MKARIGAYAGFQVRDFFVARASAIVFAAAAAAWGYGATRGITLSAFDAAVGFESRDQLQAAFEFVLATYGMVAGAVAAQGLVARDRARRFDRVFFSRPLRPVRYYTQGFVLAGLGSIALALLGAAIYGIAIHSVSLLGVAVFVALAWLTIGSLAFLLSILSRFYLAILVAVLGADFALDRYVSTVADGTIGALAQYLLPPGHVVASLSGPFARGFAPDPRIVAWPAGFGLACLVVAVFLLGRRPFRT